MKKSNEIYPLIDILKLFFAFCIIAVHTWFLYDYKIGYYLYTMLYRIPVPFFFLSSGFFLARKVNINNRNIVFKSFLHKNLNIYIFLSFLSILVNLVKGNNFSLSNILTWLWMFITGRCWGIAWFMGALLVSAIILYFMNNKNKLKKSLIIAFIIYIVGLLFNTYNFVLINHGFPNLYNFLLGTFGNNSNYIFEGYLFFGLGYYIEKHLKKVDTTPRCIWYISLIVGLLVLFFEVKIVRQHLDVVTNYEYYLAHIILIPSIFIVAKNSMLNSKISFDTKIFRNLSIYLFFIHSYVLELLLLYRNYNKGTFLDTNIGIYLSVCVVTLLISFIYNYHCTKAKKSDSVSFTIYVLSAISILFVSLIAFNKTIWVDEACTLSMMKHGIIEIIKLNINDVHPPTYYIANTIFVKLFDSIFNPVILSKIFAFIPLLILIIVGLTKVRKEYGNRTASLFIIFMVGMPQLMQYFLEIRMYSWTLCFVTLAFVYMKDILIKKDKKSWIAFVVFSLLASYNHLFGCLCIAFLYLALLLFFLLSKNNRKEIKKWFKYSVITILVYVPWIIVIISQLKKVSGGFWISPITKSDFISFFKFFLHTGTNDYESGFILFFLIIFVIIYLFIKKIIDKSAIKEEKYYCFVGLGLPFAVIFAGTLVSIIVTPLFISRYIVPALGTFWFAVAILLSSEMKKNEKMNYFLLIFGLVIFANLNSFVRYEINCEKNMIQFLEKQKEISDNAIIVSDYQHIQLIESYFHPNNKIYCYNCYNSDMINDLFVNIEDNITIEDIYSSLESGNIVYFVKSQSDIDYSNVFNEKNIKYEESEMIYEDWYTMQFIKLSL